MERTDEPETNALGEWMIVVAGTQTYVGRCVDDGTAPDTPRSVVTLAPCYRVHELQMPVEVGPGRVGLQLQTIVKAPFLCDEPVPIMLEPTALVILGTMHPADASRWRKLIEGAEREQAEQRAARSGITLASSLPRA